MSRSGRTAWGPLEIIEKVGEGTFGEVFRAWDPHLERDVALKLQKLPRRPRAGRPAAPLDAPTGPPPADTPEFPAPLDTVHYLEEARRLARLRHPNVITVHGVAVHHGRAGFWTEFVRGLTLEEHLARDASTSGAILTTIGLELGAALGAVHGAGVTHGDVKASNVMLAEDGRVLLVDFGAGSTPDRGRTRHTGTPMAMAPEMFLGSPPSTASDLYALGVLLYRLATGRYPVEASTRATLRRRVLAGRRVPLSELRPDLPATLVAPIEQALATDPAERPADALRFTAAIRAALPRGDDILTSPIHAVSVSDRFIGRGRELDGVASTLLRTRLVTLVGPGGAGKTRLAREVTRRSAGMFPGGVPWISLAPLSQPGDILRALARETGISETGPGGLERALIDHLGVSATLVVLDNCEHLVAGCAEVAARLLDAVPRLRILATSRVRLSLSAEEVIDIPPLETPPAPGANRTAGPDVGGYESVRLFVDRVSLVRPGYTLGEAETAAVARICRRLDGLPLALELAAARARALTIEEIADRLDASLRLVAGSSDRREEHQRTIDTSIEWSWNLLEEKERVLLRRLSVFAGRWSLAAAEVVAADGDACPAEEIAYLVDALVNKSLVLRPAQSRSTDHPPAPATGAAPAEPDPRGEGSLDYRLLEPIRDYAARRLQASGEEPAVRERHFECLREIVRRGRAALHGAEQAAWLARFDALDDDLRAALRWAAADPARGLLGTEVAVRLGPYWNMRGRVAEGMELIGGLLPFESVTGRARCRLLFGAASLTWLRGDLAETRRLGEEALRCGQESADLVGISDVLALLGTAESGSGNHAAARAHYLEALRISREQGVPAKTGVILLNLGVSSAHLGDLPGAIAYYEQAVELQRESGSRGNLAITLVNLGTSYLELGDHERARPWFDEGAAVATASRDRLAIVVALLGRAELHLAERQPDLARVAALAALDQRLDDEDWRTVERCAEVLAMAEQLDGRAERAACLLGLVRALLDRMESAPSSSRLIDLDAVEAAVRGQLGEAATAAAMRRGAFMGTAELVQWVNSRT